MRKTKSIVLVILLALALVSATVPLVPMVSAATPAITLPPTSQAPRASVSISGTGFGANQAVAIGFGAEVNVINETVHLTGPYNVSGGPYVFNLSHVPIKPGTYRKAIKGGDAASFVVADIDNGNGTFTAPAALLSALGFPNGTINYVTGQITLFRSTPLPLPSVTYYVELANYTYYQFKVTPAAGVTTDASGAFTANIVVPYLIGGSYMVTAIDSSGNSATSSLTVGASSSMFSKTYGGANDEATRYPLGIQTSDGGFLMTGDTQSYGAGGKDAWLVKTDANGNMQWNKTYGGNGTETACGIWNTSDGGYAVIATTSSYGAGGNDFWLLKIDAAGNLQWNKTYGGTGDDTGYDVRQTADGGYALLGYTTSFGAGSQDVWIIKTDAVGNMQWNKTFGTAGAEQGGNIILAADGGYTLPSYMSSGRGSWLIKLDQFGNMVWNQTYTLGTTSYAYIGTPTTDGGYALTGSAYVGGDSDVWLIKTDSSGNMLWNRTYGGTGQDVGGGVLQTDDGGYAILGTTSSFGAGGVDGWLIKTDSSGNMLWNRTYGGSVTDYLLGIMRTSDGGYAMVGRTNSFGAGGSDLWLIKTDASGMLPYKAPPAASAFTSVTVLPGWTWIFFVHSNGGVGAHTYQWYEGTTMLTGQTSMILPVTKTAPGTYTFYCKVTDSEGTSANSNNVTLTVMG